jgi:NADPH:quinone reductase-like Zn-dependent oxidoreductase
MPVNTAAWLNGPKIPLEVKEAPYTSPNHNEIVIKNVAIAINPIDYIKQDLGRLVFPWIKHPFITGTDIAGEVVEAGPGITRFKIGDEWSVLPLARTGGTTLRRKVLSRRTL